MFTPLNRALLPSVALALLLPLPETTGVLPVAAMVRAKLAAVRVVEPSLTVKPKLSGLLLLPLWRYLILPSAMSCWVKVLPTSSVGFSSASPLL